MPTAVTVVLLLLSLNAAAQSAPGDAFARFQQQLSDTPATRLIFLTALKELDSRLITPSSLYLQPLHFTDEALRNLWRYHQRCDGPLNGVPAVWRQFEQARCQHRPLSAAWYARYPIHPLGGSSAWHWQQRNRNAASLNTWLHVRERPEQLGGTGALSDDNLRALLEGSGALINGQTLWVRTPQQWRVYAPPVWQPLAREAGITITASDGPCDLREGALCVNATPATSWRNATLTVLATILVFSLGGLLWQRHRYHQRQVFVARMLAHELRTPVARLGNVVEQFRRDFDHLPEQAQLNFFALTDGVQRLQQMAEASRHWLQTAGGCDAPETFSRIRLSDWLAHLSEEYPVMCWCLDTDRDISFPLWWTHLCLGILLDNACRHGAPPVRLTVSCTRTKLTLQVSDAGSMGTTENRGMGLGLTLTHVIARRLKGRLRFTASPTTFTLRIPCEQHAITD